MQWRRVGLLVCPRSKQLQHCVRANLPRQTVQLHDLVVGPVCWEGCACSFHILGSPVRIARLLLLGAGSAA